MMNIRLSPIIPLLTLAVILSVTSAEAGVTVQPVGGEKTLSITTNKWFSPFALSACASGGEAVEGFEIRLPGVKAEELADAGIVTVNGELWKKDMYNFPEDRGTGKLIRAEIKTTAPDCLRIKLKEPFQLPAKPSRNPVMLPVLKLKKIPAGTTDCELTGILIKGQDMLPARSAIMLQADAIGPKLEVKTRPIDGGGVSLQVTSDKELAFPPMIRTDYGPSYKMIDKHSWTAYPNTSRIAMLPLAERKYQYDLPALALLSDNFRKAKTISYSTSPAPDSWQWRQDNTGFDLLDGDARTGWHAMPGGLMWRYCDRAAVTFELKEKTAIRKIVAYVNPVLEQVTVEIADGPQEPWRTVATLPGSSSPATMYSIEDHLSLQVVEALLPNAVNATRLRLNFKCRGNSNLILTEVELWGTRSGEKNLLPERFIIYATDRTGNVTRQVVKRPFNT